MGSHLVAVHEKNTNKTTEKDMFNSNSGNIKQSKFKKKNK